MDSRHSLFELESASLFRISGPDAERYLQARVSQDISKATEDKFLSTAVLSPQGKIQALFEFCREGEDFLFLAPSGDRESQKQALLQFKVAERLDCEDLSDSFRSLLLPESSELEGRKVQLSSDFEKLCFVGPETDLPTLETQSSEEFQRARVRANRPFFGLELSDAYLLSELNADTFVSFEKGCYPGQEVVEKIAAMGKAPFRILPVELQSEVSDFNTEDGKNFAKLLVTFEGEPRLGFLRCKSPLDKFQPRLEALGCRVLVA